MKPIKGLDDQREPSKAAVKTAAAVGKVIEYVLTLAAYLAVSAMVAYVIMSGLSMMHSQEPATPTFGFLFLWPVVWTSGIVVVFIGNLIKISTQEE